MKFPKFFSFLILFSSLNSFAAPAPIEMSHTLDLNQFLGKTFLETLTDTKGIKQHLDHDFESEYTFAKWTRVEKALNNLDGKVVRTILAAFPDGKIGLKKFSLEIEGSEFKPSTIVNVLRKNYQGKGNIFALAHFFGMASGAGTLVKINETNYYYNFGYSSGAEADDVKTGRSYGASPLHNSNDASDVMYLNELEQFLKQNNDIEKFYKTLLKTLVSTDSSTIAQISDEGKGVITDFITIYTAELDRHVMVNLKNTVHPWENDLAEATFVSLFSSSTGKLVAEGKLVDAPLKNFWAMSTTGSGRSGIGIGRADRRKMQNLITAYERENHPELVAAVESIIGKKKNSDLFQGLMEYLNNYSTQDSVRLNADKVVKTFTKFLMQTKTDANEIAEYLEQNLN